MGDYNSLNTDEQQSQNKKLKNVSILLALTSVAFIVVSIIFIYKYENKSSSDSSISPLSEQAYNRTKQFLAAGNIQTPVDPCDDFFQYSCGGFINTYNLNTTAPVRYTESFQNIGEMVQTQQFNILKQKFPFIATYFDSCVDTATLDRLGISTLQSYLTSIQSATSFAELFSLLGTYQNQQFALDAFFEASLEADFKYSNYVNLYLEQNANTGSSGPLDFSFVAEIQKAFNYSGYSLEDARQLSLQAWYFESNLTSFYTDLDYEDPDALENATVKFTPTQLFQTFPNLGLGRYVSNLQATPNPSTDQVSILGIDYFTKVNAFVGASNLADGKAYVMWHVIFSLLSFLPQNFRDLATEIQNVYGITSERSDFYDVTSGSLARGIVDKKRPVLGATASAREQFCLTDTLFFFADFISHVYVVSDWPKGSRDLAYELVDSISNGIKNRINDATWLDNATREQALIKWQNIVKNVGYSDGDWLDYDGLVLDVTANLQNRAAAGVWLTTFNQKKYNAPVDRNQMATRDYLVINAFYEPTSNSINLLAGLMAFPFFDTSLPMMLNIAAYGMVIGHEITHGFDNNGRLYNGTGAYVNWWTNSSGTNFNERAQCLINQYNSFSMGPTHVNGAYTLGENIADHGGINTAWDVYDQYYRVEEQLYPGLTNDQLFFVWFGQSWCTAENQAGFDRQVVTDVHSPAMFRVNGPLSNLPAFAKAFNCPATSKMGRSLTSDRCLIW